MNNIIIANWKMNPVKRKEAEKLFKSIERSVKNINKAEVIVCPPFIFSSLLKSKKVKLGAQNCFYEEKGAYTGETSLGMIKDSGCNYVIIGHSERRKYFQETDDLVNKKLKKALSVNLNPVFCIGETEEEREEEKTEQIIHQQIVSGLESIPASKLNKIIIAYEPVWAIGTGNPCDTEEAQKMGLLIRKIISKISSVSVSKNIKLLYGGSVKSDNAAGYIKEAGFQGLLVGGASLDPKEFFKIIKQTL